MLLCLCWIIHRIYFKRYFQTKSSCSNLQIYNLFINISISSFSAKIYILYIRIKKTLTRIGIRNVRRHSHSRPFSLHSIEMYFSLNLSFVHRLHKKINSVQSVFLFFFLFNSRERGLYVAVLFHEVGCVFETVLGWRKGAWTIPLLRFGGGYKWRGLRGWRGRAAFYGLFVLHL